MCCRIFGHKFEKYLQTTESDFPVVDGKQITKKVDTFFLCVKCTQTFKQTQNFVREVQ
jgi:hypothetical protein